MDNVTIGKAWITGATGMIGRELVKKLDSNVIVASRDPKKAEKELGVNAFHWDGRNPVGARHLEGVTHVFHLAGEPVAGGRWTDEKKKQIEESRVQGTRAVVQSLEGHPEITLLSSSAVGFYGSRGDEILDEDSAVGHGFLADVCREWEAEALKHTGRVVCIRTGVVLGKEGGALAKMLPLFKTGLAGRIGDGRQWMPWIHVDDIVGLYLHAAMNADVRGALNGVAPEPVTNSTFTADLGHALHRPTLIPAPAFAVKLALGEMASVVLASQRVLPKKAETTGYAFHFRSLPGALAELVAS